MGRRWSAVTSAVAAQRPPGEVTAVVRAAPGERLLSWGFARDGAPLVATDAGLWAYGERLAWVEIDHVGWADSVLRITAIDGETRDVALGADRDLPAVIRAEVESSVVTSRAVPLLAGGQGATVTARRRSGGEIEWRVRYDPGVPTDDPKLEAQVDAALSDLRAELGI